MSQITKMLTSSGPFPPVLATSYVTDDGTAIPAANVLNVNGSQTTEDNLNGITTAANPDLNNNLEVLLTNRIPGTATTVSNVNEDVFTFPLGATAGTFKFFVQVAGFNTSTPAGLGYSINASVRTTGAAATVISTPDADEDEDVALSDCDWDIIAIGNDVILRVLGQTGLTVNWSAVATYIFVG